MFQSTIFLSCQEVSWVEQALSRGLSVLLSNKVSLMRFQPGTFLSEVKHSSHYTLLESVYSAVFVCLFDLILYVPSTINIKQGQVFLG